MVQKVIEGLYDSIRKATNEKIPVYTEKIKQGLIKPCIFVQCENVERVTLLGDRYFLRVYVKVDYMSDSDTKMYEGDCVVEDLFSAMGMIEKDGERIRGRRISAEKNDGNLTLTAIYDVFIKDCDDTDKSLMETIEIKMR
ncbi:MAG: DUF6838 family protein [Clostridia bacterium]